MSDNFKKGDSIVYTGTDKGFHGKHGVVESIEHGDVDGFIVRFEDETSCFCGEKNMKLLEKKVGKFG
jgi:hypothetical protein